MSEQFALQHSIKWRDGSLEHMVNVRGADEFEFEQRAEWVIKNAQLFTDLAALFAAANTVATTSAPANSNMNSTPQAAPQPAGGMEVETDKYGNTYVYGHPDAPDLPDGRGKYVQKDWEDRNGNRRKAWIDPIDGPRPFSKGAEKAKIIWLSA